MERAIEKSLLNAIEVLQHTHNNFSNSDNVQSIEIDSSYFLADYCSSRNITTCAEHKNIFNEIKEIRSPVLYWFSISNEDGLNFKIREQYIQYRKEIRGNYEHLKYRNTSSYKKHLNPETNTLYVGKVEKYFWRRIVTHLGYATNKKTAGMQLFHWYNMKHLGEITLNYIVFDNKMKYLVSVLEKELAKELKPIIGRY